VKAGLAETVSVVLNPQLMGMAAVVLIALFSPRGHGSLDSGAALVLGLLLLTVAPVFETIGDVLVGRINISFEKREKRDEFYSDWMLFFSVAVIAFLVLDSPTMLALSLVFAETNALLWLINRYWTKLSLHSAAVTGFTSSVIMVLGWSWWWIYLLVIPVWWSRLTLGAHDLRQLVLGAAAAWVPAFVTYGFFFGSAF